MPEEKTLKPYGFIEDYVTGNKTPLIGAEENRQATERFLVEKKGYARQEIEVDRNLVLNIAGEEYRSQIDLVVCVGGRSLMAFKCVAGSLDSREREILSACRIAETSPIPLAVVTDGNQARILETATGKRLGQRLEDLPDRGEADKVLASAMGEALDRERLEREKLIFRTFDADNVNVQRKL